jgi:hypothetical protein
MASSFFLIDAKASPAKGRTGTKYVRISMQSTNIL